MNAPPTPPVEFELLNGWQRDFPIESRPFARIGRAVGLGEQAVVAAYRRLLAQGKASRIGAVFAPRRLGASALAALAVPPQRLAEVATIVSGEPTVNHNYEREHRWNLWFVVTAASAFELDAAVLRIERASGLGAIVLPLEEEFHIDLGFDMAASGAAKVCHGRVGASPPQRALSERERTLGAALQAGLPLDVRPFAALAERAGMDEDEAMTRISRWIGEGLVRRFGVIVRHHEMGFEANAMCVWDVPDDAVSELGRRLAVEDGVTLCYRRRRVLPDWPYNLFCMIHGRERDEVLAQRTAIAARLGLDAWPHAVLFSGRRFKQTGSRYFTPTEADHAHAR